MTFDLNASVISLAVSFMYFLIGSSKRVYYGVYFCPFFHFVFIYNTRHFMSQMTLTKNNLTNLGPNPGQLVRTVPDWLDYCVA